MHDQRGNVDETHVPGPRTPADDDVAVGTAHTDDTDGGDDRASASFSESYPAGTYASGSAVDEEERADLTDRDDVEVVDHDQALADEQADSNIHADTDTDTDADAHTDAHTDSDASAHTDSDTDADADAHTDSDAETLDVEEAAEVEAEAHEENEARGDGDFVPADVDPPADERAEIEAAADEDAEDRAWTAEHTEYAEQTGYTGHTDEGGTGTELRPGAVEAVPVGAIWAEGAAEGLRERWRELQLRFIDDPRSVAGEADQLVAEAVSTVTGALESQRAQLSAWQNEGGDDTERLRAAVRQYRDFFNHLLGL